MCTVPIGNKKIVKKLSALENLHVLYFKHKHNT